MKLLKTGIILFSALFLIFLTKTTITKYWTGKADEVITQVSPLSDDETDPKKENSFINKEYVLQRDENHSIFTNFKTIFLLGSILSFSSFSQHNLSPFQFPDSQFSAFAILKSSQSYLQVFRV